MLDLGLVTLCLGEYLGRYTDPDKEDALLLKIKARDGRDTYAYLLKEIRAVVDEDEDFLARCMTAKHYDELTDWDTIFKFRDAINERMDGYLSGPYRHVY